jgi:signal transduction histidine kinase
MALASTLVTVTVKAGATASLARITWRTAQSREQPSAEPFIALLATLTLWTGFALGAELSPVVPGDIVSTVCSLGQLGAAMLVPGIWVVYALGYTGRGTGLTSRRIVLFLGIAVPVAMAGVVLATGSSETAIERQLAPLVGFELLYLFGLFVYGTYLLVSFGGDHPRVSNAQVAVVTGGVAAPYLLSLDAFDAAWDAIGVAGGTSVGLLLSGGLLTVALRRYPVTTGFPKADHVARTRVVETLREAVVVLDWNDHVLDMNEATATLFGRSVDDVLGEPVEALAPGLERIDLPVGATGTVALQTSRGRRQFQFSVSAVADASADEENPVARTVLLRDVTDQRTRQQRLSVLNRILRHNVRNDLDVVLAHTNRIDDEEVRETLRTTVNRTLQLSTKAREAEEVMTATTDPPEPVDVADVAKSVASEFDSRDYAGDVSVVVDDDPRIVSHRTVIRRVLAELVENGLEHADTESPRVEVGVRRGPDGSVELAVADDGPGLPEREREIIAGETETQLKHGQGIGLWFVRWAVTQLGGDLEFDPNDPTGTVVTIRLHDAAA